MASALPLHAYSRFLSLQLLSRVVQVAPSGSCLRIRLITQRIASAADDQVECTIEATVIADSKFQPADFADGTSIGHAILAGAGVKLSHTEVSEQARPAPSDATAAGDSAGQTLPHWQATHSASFIAGRGKELVEAAEVDAADEDAGSASSRTSQSAASRVART